MKIPSLSGKVANTTYVIRPHNDGYRIFIGGINRAWKKTLTGAFGVVSKIGKIHG